MAQTTTTNRMSAPVDPKSATPSDSQAAAAASETATASSVKKRRLALATAVIYAPPAKRRSIRIANHQQPAARGIADEDGAGAVGGRAVRAGDGRHRAAQRE